MSRAPRPWPAMAAPPCYSLDLSLQHGTPKPSCLLGISSWMSAVILNLPHPQQDRWVLLHPAPVPHPLPISVHVSFILLVALFGQEPPAICPSSLTHTPHPSIRKSCGLLPKWILTMSLPMSTLPHLSLLTPPRSASAPPPAGTRVET